MKKKIITALLVVALIFCISPIAYPGLATNLVAMAECTCGPGGYCGDGCSNGGSNSGNSGGKIAEPDSEEASGWYIRYFVWVERNRLADGSKDDRIIMELLPVSTKLQEEYTRKFEDFSGWNDESPLLFAPADGFFTSQAEARLFDFWQEHDEGDKLTLKVGLIDSEYDDPSGAVYYEHKPLKEERIDYALQLYAGELCIEVPEDYTKAEFTFAARPDSNGAWEIILRDANGNDISYELIEG